MHIWKINEKLMEHAMIPVQFVSDAHKFITQFQYILWIGFTIGWTLTFTTNSFNWKNYDQNKEMSIQLTDLLNLFLPKCIFHVLNEAQANQLLRCPLNSTWIFIGNWLTYGRNGIKYQMYRYYSHVSAFISIMHLLSSAFACNV